MHPIIMAQDPISNNGLNETREKEDSIIHGRQTVLGLSARDVKKGRFVNKAVNSRTRQSSISIKEACKDVDQIGACSSSAKHVQQDVGEGMFTIEELKGLEELERETNDHIEVICGYTGSSKGDTTGMLKIYRDGHVLIDCMCFRKCGEENLTPERFMMHIKAEHGIGSWKGQIWVNIKGRKKKLRATALLRYFPSKRKINYHRDEFLKCKDCGIPRRFKRRNREECRCFHNASLMEYGWTCSDGRRRDYCSSPEERKSKKTARGCPRQKLGLCKGCSKCVCFGCDLCRFEDCRCRECMDFWTNR